MNKFKLAPIDRDVLVERGTHFTIRTETDSGRRVTKHVRKAEFDVDEFDARYLASRAASNYRERRNRIGRLWLATTGKSVEFESALERSILLDLDYDPTVTRVWTQPFRVDGIDPNRNDKQVSPHPDILVAYTDGRLEVIDVKPQRSLTEPNAASFDDVAVYARVKTRWQRTMDTFAFVSREVEEIGWTHRVRSEMTQTRRSNLEYVAAYRRPFPPRDTLANQIVDIATAGRSMTLIELAEATPGGFVAAMPVILHLVWHHRLEVDLDQPLNEHLPVRLGEAEPVMLVAA